MGQVVDLEQHRQRKLRGLPRGRTSTPRPQDTARIFPESDATPASDEDTAKDVPDPRD